MSTNLGVYDNMTCSLQVDRCFEVPLAKRAFNDLRSHFGEAFDDLNITNICTANYYSVVELNNGTQGAAINYANVHGPFRTAFDHGEFDRERLLAAREDRLLKNSILTSEEIGYLDLSLRFAVLNALSSQFYTCERLVESGLEFSEGFPDTSSIFEQDDSIAMIGCIGSFINLQVGELPDIKQVFFSDYECDCEYRPHVEKFVAQHFRIPSKVRLCGPSRNRMIIEKSEVVIISADCLCTGTFDELLAWSKNARHVLVVGWSYALNPKYLFDRGVHLLTVALPKAGIVDRTIEHVRSKGVGWEYPYLNNFRRGHVARAVKENISG